MYHFDLDREKQTHKFHGNYRGVVVSNNDPMSAGRVQIRVFGVYDNIPDDHLPWAQYADSFMGGTMNVGGFFVPDVASNVWVFFENGDHMTPVYWAGSPSALDFPPIKGSDTPNTRGPSQYPKNRVFATYAGHMIELDDTDGNTRVRIKHQSGTQFVIFDNGDVYEQIVGNVVRNVSGDVTETINGNYDQTVLGNKNQLVDGDYEAMTGGTRKDYAGGDSKIQSLGMMDIRGTSVQLNQSGPSFQIVSGVGFFPSDEAQFEVENAIPIMNVASSNAILDEPETESTFDTFVTEKGFPEPVADDSVANPKTIEYAGTGNTNVVTADSPYTGGDIDYSMMLTDNVSLGDLSTNAVFPHSIKAQHGLTVEQIIENLTALAANIIEPIIAEFPVSSFNSGFRTSTGGSSFHERGLACDLQWPGIDPSYYSDVCRWILENVNYDTLGIEMGNSPWLHIAFDPADGTSQRKRIFTYNPNMSPRYEFGTLINYYDNDEQIA
jgi:hypothetical protein